MTLLERRLFSPQGTPSLTLEQRRFLRELRRWDPTLSEAFGEFTDALRRDDPTVAAAASRRLLAVSAACVEAANALEYPEGRGSRRGVSS